MNIITEINMWLLLSAASGLYLNALYVFIWAI